LPPEVPPSSSLQEIVNKPARSNTTKNLNLFTGNLHFKGFKKAGLAGADLGIKLCQYNTKGTQVQLSLQ
ncbi:hypothetical protein N9089_05335, partial [Crocinitomicaceae bacterium]|nr:hypothetical protein [Crocinitomicaceae bacterium]